MEVEELQDWGEEFTAFHARFASLFGRREPREQAAKYLRGLLTCGLGRKNSWQLAEAVGEAIPDPMQRLLYHSRWDADAARDRLQDFVAETFGDAQAMVVIDETGFLKKGSHSVGVQRQYTGTAGKVENAQVGVFLAYASPRGHLLLDRRLYLPQRWAEDAARREQAGVPVEVAFQTKPELAQAMLEHLWARGLPLRWVAGDEVYGNAAVLRERIAAQGYQYVLGVSSVQRVWLTRPAVEPPGPGPQGRPRTRARLAAGEPPSQEVAEVVAGWPAQRWQRLAVARGEQGERLYDWGAQRVVESQDDLPGREVWLLARRHVADPTEMAYYLAHAPADTPLEELAKVAAQRYVVEQCLEEGKGETGLDEYAVRRWDSWHRHITLAMMAYALLGWLRYRQTVKKGGLSPSSPN